MSSLNRLRLGLRKQDLRRSALRWARRDAEGWRGGDDQEAMTENLFEAARRYRTEVLEVSPGLPFPEEKKA